MVALPSTSRAPSSPPQGKHATVFVIGAATGEMLLPFIVSSLFGSGLDAVEEEAGKGAHTSGGAPGSPVVLLWLMLVAGLVNMGFWRLAVLRGRVVQGMLQAAAAKRRVQQADATELQTAGGAEAAVCADAT